MKSTPSRAPSHDQFDPVRGDPLAPGPGDGGASRPNGREASGRRHILTIALEDYFHVSPLQGVVDPAHWYRFETRLESSTRTTLDLLDACGARATFFTLGWVADASPELVREVASRGHEIASKGYYHRDVRALGPAEFREDAARAKAALEQASGRRVLGYRMPQGRLRDEDGWMLEALLDVGYVYDSSLRLVLRSNASEPWKQFPHSVQVAGRTLLEVPLSSLRLLGLHVPIAGGNYFRQFPDRLMRRAVAHWDGRYTAPYVMYFHTWELDPGQPRVNGVSLPQQIRQYRNLEKMPRMLRHYLESYRFTSIAEHFGLAGGDAAAETRDDAPVAALVPRAQAPAGVAPAARPAPSRTAVSVVVPCYNEEQSLGYLANTLRSVSRELADRYQLTFIFVDDGSTDGTWGALATTFGADFDCTFVRHPRNLGVAAAIRTGLTAAKTDVVCSIDCDCTYDPHELGRMIPLLETGVDVVTASPYHPLGRVKNVPAVRLFLSRSASMLYRAVLRQRVHTYTSCFRVYRRTAALGLPAGRNDFLGIAEMLAWLDLRGSRIVEYPTTLEARLLGRSKMKVLRTIMGHWRLLSEVAAARLGLRRPPWSRTGEAAARPASQGEHR